MKMNLKNGFLLMYDWWPILENLPADCFKELMVALVERQRYGAPMPEFSDLRCELYYRVIEPTIERRLAGQKGGEETKKRGQMSPKTEGGEVATPPPTPASKAEHSKAKQSIAIAERSSEEERACATEALDAPAAPPPPPPPTALSEEEKEKLISWGIPENYIAHRLSRAVSYANEQGRSVAVVLLDWWEQDRQFNFRARPPLSVPKPSPPTDGGIAFSCNSFDTDDFFQAALNKSMRTP